MKLTSVLLIILATWLQLWAQTKRCDVGVQAPAVGFWTWPAESQVKVYVVESDFQPGEVSSLLAPLASWKSWSCGSLRRQRRRKRAGQGFQGSFLLRNGVSPFSGRRRGLSIAPR